jgi:hypothetical protein
MNVLSELIALDNDSDVDICGNECNLYTPMV